MNTDNLFEQCKKEEGSVMVDGVEVAIYQQPYITSEGYEAIGITRKQAQVENFDPGNDSHYALVWEMLNENEDESERCDWDSLESATLI